jgi:PilZ domain-containing protein
VTTSSKRERRQHERFPQVLDVHARCLISGEPTAILPKEFDGRIQNLSKGGACILSSTPLPASVFVSCDFPLVDSAVTVPTLMQVRWTAKRGRKPPNYISGFEFVI